MFNGLNKVDIAVVLWRQNARMQSDAIVSKFQIEDGWITESVAFLPASVI